MNILILSDGEDFALGASYQRAFEALGHTARLIDPDALLGASPLWRNRISRRILERRLIERFNQQWLSSLLDVPADVVWVGKGAWATPWLWTAYKAARPQTRLVCYNADDPITTYSRGGNRPWVTEAIGCFDLFCTYKASLVEPLRQRTGGRVARIPFAWDPAVHPMQRGLPATYDVVFVGNGDKYREEWLTRIVEAPQAAGWRIGVFGSWRDVKSAKLRERIVPDPIYGAAMARVIGGAKLSINVLRRQNEGSHNMRTFEAPGCGGLTVSQFSDEQNDIFPDNEAAIYCTGIDDVVWRIGEALHDDRRRETMRAKASEIVAGHTYVKRAEALLAEVRP